MTDYTQAALTKSAALTETAAIGVSSAQPDRDAEIAAAGAAALAAKP